MADLYVLMHVEDGPVTTALTPVEAGRKLASILHDDPGALESLWIEPFDVVVAERSLSRSDR
jgi:hypothetical protein